MQLTNAPGKVQLPFANSGAKNTVPVPSQIPITPGAASYTDGFPPLTMTAVEAGGIPPSGLDFNGILFAITALSRWYSAGASFVYDATYASAIGGYPKGARLLRADGFGFWVSVLDNNSSNPDAGGAGWVSDGVHAATSVYASATQNLTPGSRKIQYNSLEFDGTISLWDSGNQRFQAPIAGNYRIDGATRLLAPGGQNFAVEIWKNGSLIKQCFQGPQVSDGDLTFPFHALVNMAAGDYLEVYISISQSTVTLASGVSYQYAQLAYLG